MKKYNGIKRVLLGFFFVVFIAGPVFAQGYSGLSSDNETATFSENNALAKKVQEYEKKVALLERQKSIIEEKFNEVQAQRDIYYRLNIVRTLQAEILNDKIEYLEYAFRAKLNQKDNLRSQERLSFDETKDEWLFNMYEGKEIGYNPKMIQTKTRKELTKVKKELKDTVGFASKYEKEISKVSSEYNHYKSNMLKKTSLNEDFIDVLEDNLTAKKEKIDDLKDELVGKEMDIASFR